MSTYSVPEESTPLSLRSLTFRRYTLTDSHSLVHSTQKLIQELGLWLNSLAVFEEDPSSGPRTHVVADNRIQLQFQRIHRPLLASEGIAYARGTDNSCGQNTYTHKINLKRFESLLITCHMFLTLTTITIHTLSTG